MTHFGELGWNITSDDSIKDLVKQLLPEPEGFQAKITFVSKVIPCV